MTEARRLGLPVSELMRRGAVAYESEQAAEELVSGALRVAV